MEKNFAIGQSNEIVCNNNIYDLHNKYDFKGLSISSNNNVQLSFEPNLEYGKGERSLMLEFRDVDHLELSVRFDMHLIQVMEEMGYMRPDQLDDRWLLSEHQATCTDHLFFRLGSGSIRIHAQYAYFHLLD